MSKQTHQSPVADSVDLPDEIPIGDLNVDEIPIGDLNADEIPIGDLNVDEIPFNRTFSQMTSGQQNIWLVLAQRELPLEVLLVVPGDESGPLVHELLPQTSGFLHRVGEVDEFQNVGRY